MMIDNIEKHFWEKQKQLLLPLPEIGFMVFLIQKIRESNAEDCTLHRSEAQLCGELSISRKQLRAVRLRLTALGVLEFTTSEGKGGGTTYQLLCPVDTVTDVILSPVDTVTDVILSPVDTVTPILFIVETVTGGILYPVETVTGGILCSVGTVTRSICTPPFPCSPFSPSSSPLHSPSSPPISPSNPFPLRGAERERETPPSPLQACPQTGPKMGERRNWGRAEARESKETPTLQEVVEYFEARGYLHPQREGEKFWLTRYWLSKPGMHWHSAASLWNDRTVAYQEKHNAPHRSTHNSGRSRDEQQKRDRELIRAHIAEARRQAGL